MDQKKQKKLIDMLAVGTAASVQLQQQQLLSSPQAQEAETASTSCGEVQEKGQQSRIQSDKQMMEVWKNIDSNF